MGNHKFSLSEMIPNAWLYKLKQIGGHKSGTRNHQPTMKKHSAPPQTPPFFHPTSTTTAAIARTRTTRGETECHLSPLVQPHHNDSLSLPRKSYYITRELNAKTTPKSSDSSDLFLPSLDPPRKSSRKKRPTTGKSTTSFPTPSSTPATTVKYSCSSSSTATVHSFRPPPRSPPPPEPTTSSSPDHQNDVVIDVDKMSLGRKTGDAVLSFELPRIRTERKKFSDLVKEIGGAQEAIDDPIKHSNSPVKFKGRGANGSLSFKAVMEESMVSSASKEQGSRPVRRPPTGSPRFRIRVNSPRIARRAQVTSGRRSVSNSNSKKSILSESLALAKSSFDPQRDFRESMVEMIVTNNIRTSNDLEELLACYLSLNSEEYHEVIIQVFRQIWFDLNKK